MRWLAAAALGCWLAAAPAGADPAPPVPRGSRLAGDRHVSALGFRATADWYEKLWRKQGLTVRVVGPYRVGGVDVIRYLRDDSGAPWRAVHVYRSAGKTWISVIAAGPLPPPRPLDEARATE